MSVKDFLFGIYHYFVDDGKSKEAEAAQPVSAYARRNRGPLRSRPEELKSTLEHLSRSLTKYPKLLAEVAQTDRAALTYDLAICCPSIKTTIVFQREEFVSIAILEVVDPEEVKTLLEQEWLLAVDLSQVTFGNPLTKNNL